jgi:hypothetical protein
MEQSSSVQCSAQGFGDPASSSMRSRFDRSEVHTQPKKEVAKAAVLCFFEGPHDGAHTMVAGMRGNSTAEAWVSVHPLATGWQRVLSFAAL